MGTLLGSRQSLRCRAGTPAHDGFTKPNALRRGLGPEAGRSSCSHTASAPDRGKRIPIPIRRKQNAICELANGRRRWVFFLRANDDRATGWERNRLVLLRAADLRRLHPPARFSAFAPVRSEQRQLRRLRTFSRSAPARSGA